MCSAETGMIDDIVDVNIETADRRRCQARRGQHPKHHGCVRAAFDVRADVPPHLRHGIFSAARRFDAYIRFSNGATDDDRRPDAHGMAVKLVGVPGEKLVEATGDAQAQDFILVDSEVFFTGDLNEYRLFSAGFLRARGSTFRTVLFGVRMLLFHRELLKRARAFAGRRIFSPVETSYFSSVPFALGDAAVKYVAVPRINGARRSKLDSPDGLSEALVEQLSRDEIVFDFGVDVQSDANAQPIEDPAVKWSERGADRVWLATITIARQSVDPHSKLAENIAFSPWHSLEAHRPLGAINRARKPVYAAMAGLRHALNDAQQEPDRKHSHPAALS